MGQWTFEPTKIKVHELSEHVTWNRNRCIEFCLKYNLALTNTYFKKNIEKTVTYRKVGFTIIDEINEKTDEQIDYIAVQHRWKNSISNIESDRRANLRSDHYPVTATVKIKLKAANKEKGPGRKNMQKVI